MTSLLRQVAKRVRGHPRMAVTSAGSVLAAAAALVVRQRMQSAPVLPEPASLGSSTAIAVHNAAKGEVIRVVRAADQPDGALVGETVARQVRDAINSGVDLGPAAIGAVEGAVEVAHVVGESPLAAGQRAALAAVLAVEAHSTMAAERIRDVLAPYLSARADAPTGD